MKKFKLLIAAAALTMFVIALDSCSKSNDAVPDGPSATAPSSTTNVTVSTASDISFDVKTPGGYKSTTTAATGGTAAIKSEPTAGSTTGTVVVTFTAGATVSAGSASVTVTDKNSKSTTATAVVSVVLKAPIEITATITANTTWVATEKYLLKGNIYVQAPAELTIPPGTIVLGDKVTKGALIVSRGAKIHAVGTAAKPIIFTSSAPKGFRNYGDWGGVVILGKAQNNQSVDQAIEGISAPTGDNGKYGGDGSLDGESSGELQYARIEFAGIALSTDNELNGLTMGGVGSGTKIDHIQVSYSGDDSYEWFGGKVNSSYLIAYRGWDDEFDTDFGYSGYNQFLVSFRDPNIADKSGSNGFESDNDGQGDNKIPQTSATFANVTFFGPYMYANLSSGALSATAISGNYKRGAHIRRNTALKVYNSVFAGANVDGVFFDQTSGAAVFKGNYVGRIFGSAKPTPIPNAASGGTVYDDSNFATDNLIESPVNKVDLTSLFAGSANNLWSLVAPSALLASTSTLLTGGATLPTFPTGFGFNTGVVYRGAFDATSNWASSTWTNYDPNNTDY
ncbi:hypothetical protein BH10BAC4_BH10BAC4_06580 [soil metagenome]